MAYVKLPPGFGRYLGVKVLPRGDLSHLLRDGAKVVVTQAPPRQLVTAPRALAVAAQPRAVEFVACGPPVFTARPDETWPELRDNVIQRVRAAISGVDGFIERDCGDYICFDYSASGAQVSGLPCFATKLFVERQPNAYILIFSSSGFAHVQLD